MHERIREPTPATTPVPARIELDDLIEAVSRGVARALAAEDDVTGFTPTRKPPTVPVVIGIVFAPPNTSSPLSAGQSGVVGGFTPLG